MATLEVEAMLASVSYNQILIIAVVIFSLIFLYFRQSNGLRRPRKWALIGMLPERSPISYHIYDLCTKKILRRNNGTYEFKGPWFASRDMIVTSDPANVQHVLATNFSTYPKGDDTRKIFEAYGDILFTADHDEWRSHRKVMHALLRNHELNRDLVNIYNKEVVDKGLIPVLDHASQYGVLVDLQDVFERSMLDATCMMVTGRNPRSLRVGGLLQEDAVLNALHDASRAIFRRHVLPEFLWKCESWMEIGPEKKLRKASKILDQFAEECIKEWNNQQMSSLDAESFHAINFFSKEEHPLDAFRKPKEAALKDIVKGLIFAGTDTGSPVLPWFFWLLSQNPIAEAKIRLELETNLQATTRCYRAKRLIIHPEELNKLVYLHGAICETLRLFPPVPFEPRLCIQPDILPSGHSVKPNTRILLFTYAMGRMKSIWGEDCLEFKPERWINESGGIKAISPYKFMAFSAGPRFCMGKDIGLNRLKAFAATVMHNYRVHITKDQPAPTPENSIILRMKHGVIAKVTKI